MKKSKFLAIGLIILLLFGGLAMVSCGKCVDCDGSGVCRFCEGTGIFMDGVPCTTCSETGICVVCKGEGKL